MYFLDAGTATLAKALCVSPPLKVVLGDVTVVGITDSRQYWLILVRMRNLSARAVLGVRARPTLMRVFVENEVASRFEQTTAPLH